MVPRDVSMSALNFSGAFVFQNGFDGSASGSVGFAAGLSAVFGAVFGGAAPRPRVCAASVTGAVVIEATIAALMTRWLSGIEVILHACPPRVKLIEQNAIDQRRRARSGRNIRRVVP
jgi:hypothetical protein